jgi:hypothetical protein
MYGDPEAYVAAITGYDPALPGARTIYRGTKGFATKPTDTPANTVVYAGLSQPALMQRDAWDQGTTMGRSRIGFGDLELANDEGQEDVLLDWGFDGQSVVIYRATLVDGWQLPAAFPAGWDIVLSATMEQPETTVRNLVFKLRDNQFLVDIPAQATKFAGTNVLPAGLEGVPSDIMGKPKPLAGGESSNATPPIVNTDKLIAQLHDGAINGVPNAYDRGVALTQGFRWSDIVTGASGSLSCGYAGGLYIIGQTNGTYLTSATGSVWASHSPFAATENVIGKTFAHNGTLYVLTTYDNSVATAYVYSSPDAVTWTLRATYAGGSNFAAALYSSTLGLFVLVGRAGANGLVITSPNGTAWTTQASAGTLFTPGAISGIAEGNGILVIVGGGGAFIASSFDAVTWTSRVVQFTANINGLVDIVFFAGLFIAGGDAIALSPDGQNWVQTPTTTVGTPFFLAASTTEIVAISNSSPAWYQSTVDGVTWTESNPGITATPFSITYGPSGYLVTDTSGHAAMTVAIPYANTTDLLDDALAPQAGAFTVCPTAGYMRLGLRPTALTTNIVQGATAADRTGAQLWKRLLIDRGGIAVGSISAADVAAMDAANSAVLGFYQDTETPLSDLLDRIAQTLGAFWGIDRTGVFRLQRLVAPAGAPVLSFTQNSLEGLDRVATSDEDRGVPLWRVTLNYGRNYTVQDAQTLAGSVTAARRSQLGQEWRTVKVEDAAVKTVHRLAPELTIDTLYTTEADATTEATRVLTLRKVRRDRIHFTVPFDSSTATLDLGVLISVAYPRFGYTAGKLFTTIGVDPDARARRMLVTAWG